MLFNSLQFLFFFIAVTSTYFLLNPKYRWLLLLTASCYFYMVFQPVYIFILAFTISVDYFAGIFIEKSSGRRRKIFLAASILANVSVLTIFKYYHFLDVNLSFILRQFHQNNPLPVLHLLLPIGLSFHTFQAMSYTIEVFRGNQKAEKHFGFFSLYVMFFPQLVAGPIERPQNLLHQLHEFHPFDHERLKSGLLKMGEGLFKKAVIADRLAPVVNQAYSNINTTNGSTLLVATIFFAFQIYCDFAGYSDMAIGAARILGIDLMQNFNTPYFSKSIGEFWRRWHISLSTWFRDYLYIPLGGNRVKDSRLYFNIIIVFLMSGLWHGANWTFLIWGGLHGFYIIAEVIRKKLLPSFKLPETLQISITFLLVCFSWIFFRAPNVLSAFRVIQKIFTLSPNQPIHTPYNSIEMIFCCLLIVLLLCRERFGIIFKMRNTNMFYPYLALAALIIYLFGVFNYTQFIYFRF